jgi:hypothetical protein
MNSIDRAKTRRVGIRMAIKVAALSGGAVATVMAIAASDARADEGTNAAPNGKEQPKEENVGPTEALKVEGLGRFSCMSRGPAAPPVESTDFADLLARVPS